ncbi:MAG: TonB-dependent receptor plug domain-containing protein [Chitinispirillaceae bacterium]|nr:TonB-dependent receptor plug domain-containing protein [Chitinispirillaceae bacterium]
MIKKLAGIGMLVASASLFPQWYAFSEEEDAASEVSETVLDELSLGDILTMKITTGSFLELDLKKSPLSMTVITKDMIRNSGARHMSELLEIYVPGFIYNINKWNGTIWGMRGVSNDRNTKIIYLVNGHKMNTQTRDGFQSETVLGLLGDIERVEVLRGPAGLVYGTGAIAGIINVVAKKAEEPGSSVSMSGGTDGSKSIEANLYATPSDDQKLSVSAGFRQSEGLDYFKTRVYGTAGWPGAPGFRQGAPTDGRLGSTDGNWKVAADWTWDKFNIYARATHQVENAAPYFVLDPWPELSGQPLWSGDNARSTIVDGKTVANNDPYWITTESWRNGMRQYVSDALMIEGSYEVPINENSLKLKLAFDKSTSRTQEEKLDAYFPDKTYRNGKVAETFGDTRYLANATFLLKSIDKLQTALGTEFRIDDFGNDMDGNNEAFRNEKKFIIKDETYYNLSLFGEGFYDFTDVIGAHAGFRLDIHSRAVMFNPKVAFICRPNEKHSLKLIYQSASNNGTVDNYEINRYHVDDEGKINKMPVLQNVNTDPNLINPVTVNGGGGIVQPAPSDKILHELKPEKVHSVEFTYVGQFMDALTIEPSFSWNKIMDLFGWTDALFRVVNVGQYEFINADLNVKYSTKKLQIGAAHTYQRPVRTDPDKEKKTYNIYRLDSTGHGSFGYFNGYDVNGDSLYQGYYSKSAPVDLNVVKTSVTFDGDHFMSLPDHLTKLYMIYSPFEWMSLGTSLRLNWGLPGMLPVIREYGDTSYYYGFYHDERGGQSLRDFIMRSVSKKWNFSLSFYLPKQFDVNFYAYNILGTDNHSIDNDKLDRNTVNTFRKSQVYGLDQRDLYSADQRTLGITVTKNF